MSSDAPIPPTNDRPLFVRREAGEAAPPRENIPPTRADIPARDPSPWLAASPPAAVRATPLGGDFRQRFAVPPSARVRSTDPESFVIRELTQGEIYNARKAGGADRDKRIEEMAKTSITLINDHAVDYFQADAAWGIWSTKIRSLATQAFNRIHTTTDEEDAAFFASATRV